MVYVLVGESGCAEVAPGVWTSALTLGRRYGWEPRGTLRGPAWTGSYVVPNGQLGAARDASSLALALEDSLDDLPDFDPPMPRAARRASLLEQLGGSRKSQVVRLTEFLRGGAFTIHGACRTCRDPAE